MNDYQIFLAGVLTGYLLVLNVAAFIAYGVDKDRAKSDRWRIPENFLIILAALGGPLGAILGMFVFHHKTLHMKFKILNPLFLAMWIGLIVCICVL